MASWAVNLENLRSGNSILANEGLRLPKTIAPDERVLLYRKHGGDVDFVETTNVEFLKTGPISGVADQVIAIQLRPPIDFLSPSSLSALAYSLKLISRFDDPSRHFNKSIRKIPDEDYDTIEKQCIFWARSAFGIYLNALPTDRFLEFVQHIAMLRPGLLIDTGNFHELWALLRDWIQEEYVDAYHYATAIRDSVSRIVAAGTEVPFNSIRVSLSDEKTASSGKLSALISNLESFYLSTRSDAQAAPTRKDESNGLKSIFEEIDQRIAENQLSELAFEKTFAGKTWPIKRRIKI